MRNAKHDTDKTLEELAADCYRQINQFELNMAFPAASSEKAILSALQSATASRQREVERLVGELVDTNTHVRQALIKHCGVVHPLTPSGDIPITCQMVDMLSAQLRTEQERNRQWRRYAQHGVQCDLRPDEPCSCGLQALRDSTPKQKNT